MSKHAFKVRKNKDTGAVEFQAELPKTLENQMLIEDRFGTVERMIDRANSQWIVDVAVGARKRLPNVEDAQKYVNSFCDNGTRDGFVRPKIDLKDAKAQGFSEEQLAFLTQKGMI